MVAAEQCSFPISSANYAFHSPVLDRNRASGQYYRGPFDPVAISCSPARFSRISRNLFATLSINREAINRDEIASRLIDTPFTKINPWKRRIRR